MHWILVVIVTHSVYVNPNFETPVSIGRYGTLQECQDAGKRIVESINPPRGVMSPTMHGVPRFICTPTTSALKRP